MTGVPDGRSAAINWYTERVAAWVADPTAIGLSIEQANAIASETSTASSTRQSAFDAANVKKAAFVTYHEAADTMRENGSTLIATIKAYAEATGDPGVYAAALIDPPAQRTPTPAPGTPYDFSVGLLQDGSVELSFKCDNPSATGGTAGGVVYEVFRQDPGSNQFNYVLSAGERRFVDSTVPPGSALVSYRIVARRSTKVGPPAVFGVRFGVSVNGQQDAEIAA